jgi:tRNA A37 threonylcarbamoyladenosine dehydratase
MILWSESDKLVFVGANYGDIDPKKVKVFDIKTATWDPLWVS